MSYYFFLQLRVAVDVFGDELDHVVVLFTSKIFFEEVQGMVGSFGGMEEEHSKNDDVQVESSEDHHRSLLIIELRRFLNLVTAFFSLKVS